MKGSCRPLGAWCALVSWSCCLHAYLLSHLQQLWSSMPTSEVEAGLSILLQYFTQFLCKQAGAESRRFLLACRALFPVLKVAMGSLRLLSPATMLLNFSCSSAAVLRAFTCSSHHLVAHGHHLGLGASGVSSLGSRNTCSTCGTACRMRLVDVGYPYPSLQQGALPFRAHLSWCAGQETKPILLLKLMVLGRAGLPHAFGLSKLKAQRRKEGWERSAHSLHTHSFHWQAVRGSGQPKEEQSPLPASSACPLLSSSSVGSRALS